MKKIDIKPTDKIIVDVEMLPIEFTPERKAILREEVAKKYEVPVNQVLVNFIPITVQNGERISLTDNIIKNVQDPQFQKELMQVYINEKNIEDINFEDISEIDDIVNADVEFDQYSKYKNYQFKYVKWSNYLSYGPDNYFDFTNLKGLVLLNSDPANQGGKTTFAIDLLRFALFGSADKCPTNADVFNAYLPEATEVLVEVGLRIENEDYVIKRTVTRPTLKRRTAKSTCSQKVEFYKIGENQEEINCAGATVTETDKLIKEFIGNVEDYNLVVSATNYTLGELTRKTNTERNVLFSRWLGLVTIKKKEEVAKKVYKTKYEPNLLSKRYNPVTLKEENESYTLAIADNNQNIIAIDTEIEQINQKLDKLNKEKIDVLSKIKPIKDGLDKIDVTTVNYKLESAKQQLAIKESELATLTTEYNQLKDIVFDQTITDQLQLQKNAYNDAKTQLLLENNCLRTEAKNYQQLIKEVQALLDAKICTVCKQPIPVAENTNLISEYQIKIQEISSKGVTNKNQIELYDKKLADIDNMILEQQKIKQQVDRCNTVSLKIEALNFNIESIKKDIENYINTINEIKNNEESIKYNNNIKNEANIIEENIKIETNVKTNKIQNKANLNSENNSYKKAIEERIEIINKIAQEEILIRNWNLYLEMVGNNGIVKIALREALPLINSEIERILSGLCDFDVNLSFDDKNNVVLNLTKEGVSLDLGKASSGFEETMASLALRSALASTSTMSKPNFLCLDEVLQGVAASNYEKVHELYKRIVCNYDFILHITHNENLVDWHTGGIITVTKVKNISKLK
jgi:DNA repair exonuclease SbcCD ATPase subunit